MTNLLTKAVRAACNAAPEDGRPECIYPRCFCEIETEGHKAIIGTIIAELREPSEELIRATLIIPQDDPITDRDRHIVIEKHAWLADFLERENL